MQRYECENRLRLTLLPDAGVNGIEFLEVLDDEALPGLSGPGGDPIDREGMRQRTLVVRFVSDLPETIDRARAAIDGGVRITPVEVQWAFRGDRIPADHLSLEEQVFFGAIDAAVLSRTLVVRLRRYGDYDRYRFRIVFGDGEDPFDLGFDPILSDIAFGFKVECPSDFDCRVETACPEPAYEEPNIDYLAKDFRSFRGAMLDRLATIAPALSDRNPADLAMTLVELLAHAADLTSYHQDAAATEAYLHTARRRVSVRRHARLLDYFLSEGQNARAWVVVDVAAPVHVVRGNGFLTRLGGPRGGITRDDARRSGAPHLVFEAMHDLFATPQRNAIELHTWGDDRCCLPQGATAATLRRPPEDRRLAANDVLVLEEVRGGDTGRPEDLDPSKRHVVRLTSVRYAEDRVLGVPIAEVVWHDEDALPFPMCLYELEDPSSPGDRAPVTLARANVVLVDHGESVDAELPSVGAGRYRPELARAPLTHVAHVSVAGAIETFDPQRSAARTLTPGKPVVRPAISLEDADRERWDAVRDLLGSAATAREFVVELDDEGRATLRFGDHAHGLRPPEGARFTARHRVGNGAAGNVGPEAIAHLVTPSRDVRDVRNPLGGLGGVDPESIAHAKLVAPYAYRVQERAVVPEDYARVAELRTDVQRAAATLRWTGSWTTVFIAVDRRGGREVDAPFEAELVEHFERYRLAGYDVEIHGPTWVPIDLSLTACVADGYFRSDVARELRRALGPAGFFHPDRVTFGEPVHLSQLVAHAMAVEGVHYVDLNPARGPHRFHRFGKRPSGEFEAGRIAMSPLEIARLDDDPNRAENGRLELHLEGGL